MKTPSLPTNEYERLHKLRALNILDTAPEERFDRLTRLAKRLFNVPIALVSLVDEDRQWFKSCIGLPVRETSRDISFCGHAILDKTPLVVKNALEDERFFDNPLVTGEPHIRFYAGCPIELGENERIGTLCIIDTEPREFDEEDARTLKDLAEMAENELAAVKKAALDSLTGLLNRHGFIGMAETTFDFCRQHRIPTTLAFIDLNRFKLINDTYGHKEGDIALIEFSQILKNTFRITDLQARLGGDEFIVLLIGAEYNHASVAMENLRKNIERWNSKGTKPFSLDYAFGLVETDINRHNDLNSVIAEGDSKMYQQKKNRQSFSA